MSPTAKQLLAILENISQINLKETANFKFMRLLREKLVPHFGSMIAEKIVTKMTVQLDEASVDEDFLNEATTRYAKMIVGLRDAFADLNFQLPEEAVVNCSPQLNINLQG